MDTSQWPEHTRSTEYNNRAAERENLTKCRARTMSFSRGDDFPESTLVDDDRAVNGRPNKHAGGRGYGRVSQQHNMNRGLHRPHTGMRQDHWERRRPVHMSTRTTRTPVDIDRAPLVSLGRAMSNKGWGNHSLGNGGDKMTQNETSEGGGTHHPLATQGHGPPSEGGGVSKPKGEYTGELVTG